MGKPIPRPKGIWTVREKSNVPVEFWIPSPDTLIASRFRQIEANTIKNAFPYAYHQRKQVYIFPPAAPIQTDSETLRNKILQKVAIVQAKHLCAACVLYDKQVASSMHTLDFIKNCAHGHDLPIAIENLIDFFESAKTFIGNQLSAWELFRYSYKRKMLSEVKNTKNWICYGSE